MASQYPFTSWVYRNIGVYPPEELDTQVECGLNIPMTPPFEHKNEEHIAILKKYLDRALTLGVKLILHADFSNTEYVRMGDDRWSREFKEFYEVTLCRHPAVCGFMVGDEPSTAEELELTKKVIVRMKQIHPELLPYINFMGSMGTSLGEEVYSGKTMAEWLKALHDEAGDFLHSYDHYSQLINENGGTSEYFVGVKGTVEPSEKAGIEPWGCLICSGHMVYHAASNTDIIWQINTAAACGFKGICWFRMYDSPVVPNYHGSPIDEYGVKTTLYYDMQRAIRRFRDQHGEMFMKLKRKSTYFFGEDKNRGAYDRFEEGTHDAILYVRNFEESLISFFEHEETGDEYFCIVNASRKFYDHYEIFTADGVEVVEVLENGAREHKVPKGPRDENWDGDYLYPGQLSLFRIIRK